MCVPTRTGKLEKLFGSYNLNAIPKFIGRTAKENNYYCGEKMHAQNNLFLPYAIRMEATDTLFSLLVFCVVNSRIRQ